MPAARQALLTAARAALDHRPWPVIRMAEVAAAARVSRQTLYNEFGGKDGLARALARRAADGYLAGAERVLRGAPGGADVPERLASLAQWTVDAARADPLVRAVLTGCWDDRFPAPAGILPAGALPAGAVPRRRRPGPAPVPTPEELLGQVRERAVRVLSAGRHPGDAAALARACETAARLALSWVVAPAGPDRVAELVRGVVPRPVPRPGPHRTPEVSARSRRAGAR
ncbi:TetR family transcriptional regulator [Streptomyces pactum]|uniref:TetR family transcriptional regulator n=1 Tax=Streptomyces pactum TaxID=68249 RepID=UPI0036FCAB6C